MDAPSGRRILICLGLILPAPDAQPAQIFTYDGEQMIEAYKADTGDILWSAIWGEGIDHLLEYTEFDNPEPFVPITDHRNSVVGWWQSTEFAGTRNAINVALRLRIFRWRLVQVLGVRPWCALKSDPEARA